jgi:hypothetical protein
MASIGADCRNPRRRANPAAAQTRNWHAVLRREIPPQIIPLDSVTGLLMDRRPQYDNNQAFAFACCPQGTSYREIPELSHGKQAAEGRTDELNLKASS